MVEADTIFLILAIVGSSATFGIPIYRQLSNLCMRLSRLEGKYETHVKKE